MTNEQLISYYEQRLIQGDTPAKIAASLGISETALTTRIWRARSRVAGPADLRLPAPLTIDGDAVVVGDVHCPYHSEVMVERVVSVGRTLGIDTLIVAGDLTNQDQYSAYPMDLPGPSWRDEVAATREVMQLWTANYRRVFVLMGNHDRRIIRAKHCRNHVDLVEQLCKDTSRVTSTAYGWATLRSGGVPWRITHPRAYNVKPLSLASELAVKYQTNLVSFHEHHWGIGRARYGNWIIVNGGCLADPSNLAYSVLDDGPNPQMVQGFVSIVGGKPALYDDGTYTDWAEYA